VVRTPVVRAPARSTGRHQWQQGRARRSSVEVPVRVVIAEDSLIVREGIEQLLEFEHQVELVGSCVDLPQLMDVVERELPDVVLTDLRMPPDQSDEGVRVASWLRHAHPQIGVIVLSQYAEPRLATKLLEDGSQGRGYLLKERIRDATQLRTAIETVAAGGVVIDPKLVDALIAPASELTPLGELTPRERDVLAHVAQGMSNAAIADALVLTKSAVEKHINSIFIKLGLTDADDISKRVKAALLFLAAGDAGHSHLI
jgi:DNA-binding NarL/FixJ family response regulator